MKFEDMPTSMIIGKNGSGKSTISKVLEIIKEIAYGNSRLISNDATEPCLVMPSDFSLGRTDVPMRFQIEVSINDHDFMYDLALELPKGFKALRVFEEKLVIDGNVIYTREKAKISFVKQEESISSFQWDWHSVALPTIYVNSEDDPIQILRAWLSRMVIISPNPSQIDGVADKEAFYLERGAGNFGRWLLNVLSVNSSSVFGITEYIKDIMPDFNSIKKTGIANKYFVSFKNSENGTVFDIPFEFLSDGEKCFFICAAIIAANQENGPLFCFWDEPDNYLSPSEISHFIRSLRRGFQTKGQLIVSSHHPEAIARFSNENTFVLTRNSHLEPIQIRSIADIPIEGSLYEALMRGDII